MRSSRLGVMGLAALLLAGADRVPGLPEAPTDALYRPTEPARVKLGQLLFYDPILSGGRDIACVTCHSPRFGTSDGVSLGMGEGGIGMGPARHGDPANMPEERIPRNANALWNLGAYEFERMFHDGRVEIDPAHPGGYRTPLEGEMLAGFDSALAAQTMFPVLSPDEMAGHYAESDMSQRVRSGRITGPDGAWALLAARVAAIPDYAARFAGAYPEIAAGRPIAFTDIANALGEFITAEFRSDTSPFDRYLRGEGTLDPLAGAGMALFYGRATCATCHSGPFQTDQGFHARGEPQLGPGKAERFEHHSRDIGRMRVTNDPADIYKFRTPSLRNVTRSGPWGHAGAHGTLDGFIRFHADPVGQMAAYPRDAVLPDFAPEKPDWAIMDDPAEVAAILSAVSTPPIVLSDDDIAALVAFLGTLTDETALKGRLGAPETVPSGLPFEF